MEKHGFKNANKYISDAFEGATVTREGKKKRFLSSSNNIKLFEEN